VLKVMASVIGVNDDIRRDEEVVVSNKTNDSSVILSGYDSTVEDINELRKLYVVVQNLPREITELKSDTYSIKLKGEHACEILTEIIEVSIQTIRERNDKLEDAPVAATLN
jgi:predicted MarR family transcription regulator